MIPYSEMPLDSRVWIYQCSRTLSSAEKLILEQKANEFVSSWTAHDNKLKTFFELRYGIFFILMVDEKQAIASGCSIDKLMHFIRQLEKEFSVSFTDRMLFAYRNKDKEISIVKKKDFEKLVSEGIIEDKTFVFDTLISHKAMFDSHFEIPFADSWHKKIMLS